MLLLTIGLLLPLMSTLLRDESPMESGLVEVCIMTSLIVAVSAAWLLRGFQSGRIVVKHLFFEKVF